MFPVFTTFFQITRISTIFKVSSCILYEKNPFFCTYNLQQIACRYLKKCALESLLKTGHWIETPCIFWPPCSHGSLGIAKNDFRNLENMGIDTKMVCLWAEIYRVSQYLSPPLHSRTGQWHTLNLYIFMIPHQFQINMQDFRSPTWFAHFRWRVFWVMVELIFANKFCLNFWVMLQK